MLRTTLRLAVLASLLAIPVRAEEPREVKIIARGDWPHLPTHIGASGGLEMRHWAIRSDKELINAAGRGALVTVPKVLKVDSLDFKKQMLLAVEDGTQPMVGVSGGGPPSAPLALVFVRVERNDKTMTVFWGRVPREPKHGIITRPLVAALVEHFDGDVKFQRLPDKPADEPKPAGTKVKILAEAFWREGWPKESPRQEWVIRNYSDLIDPRLRAPEHVLERMRQEQAARYAKALKVKQIDWDKQMIIGVSGGVLPAGSNVEITRIDQNNDKSLTVHWRLHEVPVKSAKGIIHPAQVVLVERTMGEVKFKQEAEHEE